MFQFLKTPKGLPSQKANSAYKLKWVAKLAYFNRKQSGVKNQNYLVTDDVKDAKSSIIDEARMSNPGTNMAGAKSEKYDL